MTFQISATLSLILTTPLAKCTKIDTTIKKGSSVLMYNKVVCGNNYLMENKNFTHISNTILAPPRH